mmetsp:Transcript_7021/g.31724  ORF Transcript_7021/g.31724 Transcript_7021/m.31724 type:complete len:283 (+) Transcript_7021:1038-1886(+)
MNLVPGTRIHGGGGGGGSAGGTYTPGLTGTFSAPVLRRFWTFLDDSGRRAGGSFRAGARAVGSVSSPRARANTGATPAATRVGCQPFLEVPTFSPRSSSPPPGASSHSGAPPGCIASTPGIASLGRRAATAASSARRLARSPTCPSDARSSSSTHRFSDSNDSFMATAASAKSPWSTAWSHAATSCHSPSPPSSHVAPNVSSVSVRTRSTTSVDSSWIPPPEPPPSKHALTCASLAGWVSARSRRSRKHTGHVVASSPSAPASSSARGLSSASSSRLDTTAV